MTNDGPSCAEIVLSKVACALFQAAYRVRLYAIVAHPKLEVWDRNGRLHRLSFEEECFVLDNDGHYELCNPDSLGRLWEVLVTCFSDLPHTPPF